MALSSLEEAVAVIRMGGVVAFPTETCYGLAVDPENDDALRKLYRVKQRHSVKPILVLIEGVRGLESIASAVPDIYLPLMEKYWPGPLTLIFPAKKEVSSTLTGGTGTVGVRVSPHPLAISLVRKMGNPVTATSANLSGRTPASSPREVKDIFGDRVDYILDGGETVAGKPSTLVGIRKGKLTVLREGQLKLTDEELSLIS
ncbi:MAG: threonylcarbamoyl-AMP synthase [Deltaproteobacteria bacterium]|nr:threonylcarbamoyl-AMP synthase [Deltaproteobacteria bacterium]